MKFLKGNYFDIFEKIFLIYVKNKDIKVFLVFRLNSYFKLLLQKYSFDFKDTNYNFPLKISHVMSGQIFQKTPNSKIEISQKAKNTP